MDIPELAVLPKLRQFQSKVSRLKATKVAGVVLTSRSDLLTFIEPFMLPAPSICRTLSTTPSAEEALAILGSEYLVVPQDAICFGVDGVCLTGPTQIRWMKQLLDLPGNFCLHVDGKYKLHHAEWILITLGTHCNKLVGVTSMHITNTFIPLVYMMTREHESNGACIMLSGALDVVTMRCFGKKLEPGALMADHSAGIRMGYMTVWPDVPIGQCWPHIKRKYHEGEFCSKKHPHFELIGVCLDAVHMAQSEDMRDFLICMIGPVWDSWGEKWNLRSFWNEYMVHPWDNWSIGLFDCMLATPSQQTEESWHKLILRSRIPGMFKGSTASVMKVAQYCRICSQCTVEYTRKYI